MRTLLPVAASVAVALILPVCARAQTVAADKENNVVYTDASGKSTRLTNEGKDSAPSLDPAKRRVVFVRATPGKAVETGVGEGEATELWLIDVTGKNATMLLRGKSDPKMERVLADFDTPQFSPNGKIIYFGGSAWVTSGAIHAYDLAARREHFVCPGSGLIVVPNGEYAGCLLVQQHRYFLGGGSYDWFYLLRPNGKEVAPVGEDTQMFQDTYVKPVL